MSRRRFCGRGPLGLLWYGFGVMLSYHHGTMHVSEAISRGTVVGSGPYPFNATADFGDLGRVNFTKAGVKEPLRISIQLYALPSLEEEGLLMFVANTAISMIGVGKDERACEAAAEMYDPDKRGPPHVSSLNYLANGCLGPNVSIADALDFQEMRMDACAKGDLSSKFGALHGLGNESESVVVYHEDKRLNETDVLGKALVLANMTGDVVACVNIDVVVETREGDEELQMRRLDSETRVLGVNGADAVTCSSPTPKCIGGPKSVLRISGGNNTLPGQYPWIVYMNDCAGVLIAPDRVLTAAHCVIPHGPIAPGKLAYIGCHERSSRCKETNVVNGVYDHELFSETAKDVNGKRLPKYSHDIAVLTLMRPSMIAPVMLGTHEDDPAFCEHSSLTVAGWGTTASGRTSDVLQEVEVPAISQARCIEAHGDDRISETMFCAGFEDGGCDSCKGDSGGPLFVTPKCMSFFNSSSTRVVGIVSWGPRTCGESNGKFGVYTKIATLRDWIASKMPGGRLPDLNETIHPDMEVDLYGVADGDLCEFLSDDLCEKDAFVRDECPRKCGKHTCELVSLQSVDCMGNWSEWSECSEACGDGKQQRTYAVTTEASNGGRKCDVEDGAVEEQTCNLGTCTTTLAPVDCVGSWSDWWPCSVTCGDGTQVRVFKVERAAANGGKACEAENDDVDRQPCSQQACATTTLAPVNCVGSWSKWLNCTVACGGGFMVRVYHVKQAATNGGGACEAEHGDAETQPCNEQACTAPSGAAADLPEPSSCMYPQGLPGETRRRQLQIVNGEAADKNLYPWLAYLGFGCSGSVIAPTKVLTAAHCVDSPRSVDNGRALGTLQPGSLVHLGCWGPGRNCDESIRVRSIEIHPKWDMRVQPKTDYDVAVITLERPTIKPAVRFADPSLDQYYQVNISVVAAGWGVTEPGGESLSDTLQHVELNVVSDQDCRKQYSDSLTDRMFCAGGLGKDSCQGDTGVPLIMNPLCGGEPLLLGIVSWGRGCGSPGVPGVYTNVGHEEIHDFVENSLR